MKDSRMEFFDLLQVRGGRYGDELLHLLILDLDHFVELAEGGGHGPDALVVNVPHLPHRYHDATTSPVHLMPARGNGVAPAGRRSIPFQFCFSGSAEGARRWTLFGEG